MARKGYRRKAGSSFKRKSMKRAKRRAGGKKRNPLMFKMSGSVGGRKYSNLVIPQAMLSKAEKQAHNKKIEGIEQMLDFSKKLLSGQMKINIPARAKESYEQSVVSETRKIGQLKDTLAEYTSSQKKLVNRLKTLKKLGLKSTGVKRVAMNKVKSEISEAQKKFNGFLSAFFKHRENLKKVAVPRAKKNLREAEKALSDSRLSGDIDAADKAKEKLAAAKAALNSLMKIRGTTDKAAVQAKTAATEMKSENDELLSALKTLQGRMVSSISAELKKSMKPSKTTSSKTTSSKKKTSKKKAKKKSNPRRKPMTPAQIVRSVKSAVKKAKKKVKKAKKTVKKAKKAAKRSKVKRAARYKNSRRNFILRQQIAKRKLTKKGASVTTMHKRGNGKIKLQQKTTRKNPRRKPWYKKNPFFKRRNPMISGKEIGKTLMAGRAMVDAVRLVAAAAVHRPVSMLVSKIPGFNMILGPIANVSKDLAAVLPGIFGSLVLDAAGQALSGKGGKMGVISKHMRGMAKDVAAVNLVVLGTGLGAVIGPRIPFVGSYFAGYPTLRGVDFTPVGMIPSMRGVDFTPMRGPSADFGAVPSMRGRSADFGRSSADFGAIPDMRGVDFTPMGSSAETMDFEGDAEEYETGDHTG